MFLWKLMHDAVPVRSVFARVLRVATPPCEICGNGTDDPVHALFMCPKAEQCWLTSSIGLRVHALPVQARLIVRMLSQHLTEPDFMKFANHMWAFWKARCKEVYEGAKINVRQVNSTAHSYTFIANLTDTVRTSLPRSTREQYETVHHISMEGNTCKMDGSYHSQGQAGWAYTLYLGQQILEYGLNSGTAASPLHAESLAMLQSLRAAIARGWDTATFLTDCQVLTAVIKGSLAADTVDWKAYTTILQVINIFKQHQGFVCCYVPRASLLDEHHLANRARIFSLNTLGYSFPSFPPI
ncbi:hypothetical protein LUZ62_063436 [Rhynchospora pubera]|uniref:RNase H type-1 domain-containing protein n=1 Tax=Rhynchospora pubera TaxID=906938 RepID=A0AAV8EFH1_9POAL|nr:hypothetical protein LUZ62_063436 [Rhynchospora pubera]